MQILWADLHLDRIQWRRGISGEGSRRSQAGGVDFRRGEGLTQAAGAACQRRVESGRFSDCSSRCNSACDVYRRNRGITMSATTERIRLEPWSVEIEVPIGSPLISILSANGVEFPCGGTGICGGCGVRLLSGSLPVSIEDKAAFTPDEIASGWRLACQARVEGPLVLECGQGRMDVLTDDTLLRGEGKRGLGIAI